MLDLHGISTTILENILDVSTETAKRYKKIGHVSGSNERLLRACHLGDLGAINPDWHGFSITKDHLTSQYGDIIPKKELNLVWLRVQQLQDAQRIAREPQQWQLL